MNMNLLKKDLYTMRYALVIVILYCIVMQYTFGTVCPVKAFFKINCPGCGLTHATIYLLQGKWTSSLSANPTCILWLSCISLFILDRYIYPLKIKPFPYLISIVGLITLVWYTISMI